MPKIPEPYDGISEPAEDDLDRWLDGSMPYGGWGNRTTRTRRRIWQLVARRDAARALIDSERLPSRVEYNMLAGICDPLPDAARRRKDVVNLLLREMRASLGVMLAGLDMLSHSLGTDASRTQRDVISQSHDSGEEILQKLSDLLKMHSTKPSRTPARPLSMEMAPLVHRAANHARRQAEESGVMVLVQVPDELGRVWADPWLTWQVVTHLISRAILHTPRGEGIIIAVRPGDRSLTVSVADGGLGMPPSQPDEAAGEGSLVPAGGRSSPGQDIWLGFCKQAIEAQQGHIWMECREGQGREYKFTLPLAH
jgi:signal transduction histidine kinase